MTRVKLCVIIVHGTIYTEKGGFRMDNFEKVKEITAEQLGIDEDRVTMDASFINDLEADSLDIVELMMALEDEFGIEIPDEEAEKISTVGDAVNYINENC